MNLDCHTSCVTCHKKKDSLFEGLGREELTVLDSRRVLVKYAKGETIYKEGSKSVGLLCLSDGKVKIVKKGLNDKEQIIELKKPVDFMGLRTLVGRREYTTSAIALEESTICIVDQRDFFAVLQGNIAMSLRIIEMLSDQLDHSSDRVVSLTQEHLSGRLAETLLHVMDVYGVTNYDKRIINVQLSRADIASLANMTTANAIRTLSDFNKKGLILLSKKNIKILDKDKLEALCLRKTRT